MDAASQEWQPDSLYSELSRGQIRLLRILRNTGTEDADELHLELFQCDFDTAPKYAAVSYTWGAPEEKCYMLDESEDVNAEDTSTPIVIVNGLPVPVGENLHSLLLEFRSSYAEGWGSTHYWIDALCINQSNLREKSVQVQLMSQIYKRAGSALIWLGPAHERSIRTFNMMRELANVQVAYELGEAEGTHSVRYPPTDEELNSLGVFGATEDDWLALVAFHQRRWFSRVWTLQEAALSELIVCRVGQYRVNWEDIVMSARYLDTSMLGIDLRKVGSRKFLNDNEGGPYITYLAGIFWGTRGLVSGEGLEGENASDSAVTRQFLSDYGLETIYSSPAALLGLILGRLRGFGATEERDRVFALLGIIAEIAATHLKPTPNLMVDYEKSPVEVYTEAMACVFNETGSLSMLWEAQDPSLKRVPGLPSWVSDFSQRYLTPLTSTQKDFGAAWANLNDDKSEGKEFCASAKVTRGFRIVGDHLMPHVLQISTVRAVGESYNEFLTGNFERSAALILAMGADEGDMAPFVARFINCLFCGSTEQGPIEDMTPNKIHMGFNSVLVTNTLQKVLKTIRQGGSRSQYLQTLPHQFRLADLDHSGTIPSEKDLIECCPHFGLLERDMQPADREVVKRIYEERHSFISRLEDVMTGRRTFLLSDGRLGLGGQSIQPGDDVCLVADGARTPFVLRRLCEDQGQMRLISDAFVEGVMFGEAVQGSEGEPWREVCII